MTASAIFDKMVNVGARFGLTHRLAVDYLSLLGGQVGRLVFSLVYFITLTRTLSLGEFGIFATISAIGIVLSRISGLGFISPLFRVATIRPYLIGTYTGGFIVALFLSLGPIALIAWGLHATLYIGLLPLAAFAAIIAAEVLMWRLQELVIIVNNGLGRYLTASLLAIAGVAAKAGSALWFGIWGTGALEDWAGIYLATNALIALASLVFFYPKQKLRWKPKAWLLRSRDAIGVSAAETLFYVQSELDKLLVLALGGEATAGLYAIIMRIVDLTAMPLRALSTMLTQWIMRSSRGGKTVAHTLLVDAAIASVSVAALVGVGFLLWLFPQIAGDNIALATGFLPMVVLVPAFRNLIEYHFDLLYGHGRMALRVALLCYLGLMKAALLWAVMGANEDFSDIALWLNVVFGALYLASALVTYSQLAKKSGGKPVSAVDQPA